MKILIVDDEPLVRLGIKALFSKTDEENLYLYEAANGVMAVEVLEETILIS